VVQRNLGPGTVCLVAKVGDKETETLFDSDRVDTAARPTMATAAGEVNVQTRGKNKFVTNALEIWNSCAELRSAATMANGSKAATALAKNLTL
jgi:azurin